VERLAVRRERGGDDQGVVDVEAIRPRDLDGRVVRVWTSE
jgi:hypothetical protein